MTLREGDAEAALAREVELWEAFRRRDRAAVERLVDPLALDVERRGPLDRDGVLAAIERMTVSAYALSGLRARSASGVEIVTYEARVDGTYAGAPFPARRVAVTSVWEPADGGWRLVHRHESALDD